MDVAEQGVPWAQGLNFNGIVLTPDRRHLAACQTNLGRFWQVALDTGRVQEVALEGGPLEHSDGLALSGSTLYVAVNARNQIAVVDLAEDGSLLAPTGATFMNFQLPGANGIKIRGKLVYVSNTATENIFAIPILSDGEGRIAVRLIGIQADDFAFAANGDLYVTENPLSTLIRVTPGGDFTTVAPCSGRAPSD